MMETQGTQKRLALRRGILLDRALDFDKNKNLKLDPEELKAVGKTVKESLADFD